MELGKVSISRSEFKDHYKGSRQQHLFCEVLLLDKSSANTRPRVFQLHDSMRPSLENLYTLQNFSGRFEDAFILAGELLELDMEKKIVRLNNDLAYSYGRLITATTHMDSLEISTLLITLKNALLLEALRLEQKMGKVENNKSTHSYTLQASSDELEKIVHPCIDSNRQNHGCPDIASSSKTLCQVQL